MLTVSFATGTEPGKWFRRFRDRTEYGGLRDVPADDALGEMLAGHADIALTRLPDSRVTEEHHVVNLYEEAPGVAVPKGSIYAELGDAVAAADIAEEIVNYRLADDASINTDELRTALQVVAANVGVAIAPRPLLKVLSKKQVVPLELIDASVPRTFIGLVWPKAGDSDAIQDFVGITKGRTRSSSRQATPKRSAREKTLAKQVRRQKGSGSQRRRGHKRR